MQVKVLSKAQCLKIAKAITPGEKDKDVLLWQLPDCVFSSEFTVSYVDGDIHVYAELPWGVCWCIPPYFIDEIFH